jgi:tetratricopeptide (TPR) repeat protein
MRSRPLSAATKLVVAILLSTGTARAAPPLWERATTDSETAARIQRYQDMMHAGQELGKVAMAIGIDAAGNQDNTSPAQRLGATNRALQAFRDAAAIDDQAAEPHYYMAQLLLQLLASCRGCPFEVKNAHAAVAAIDAFETWSPLDPRLTGLLFSRAILETRLSGAVAGSKSRALLERALADYRALLARSATARIDTEEVYGNMAETLMMLGNLEESIEQYRQALRMRPGTSTTLGLAVALDRDERGTEARALIRDLGRTGVSEWELMIASGAAFYVPEGEVYYYRGLIEEALGNFGEAIAGYNLFIKSGASSQFAVRAASNRDALRTKKPR